jgi:hypothetical protein
MKRFPVIGLLVAVVVGYIVLRDQLFPLALRGTFLSAAPGAGGKMWFETFSAFTYTSRTSTPGRTSSEAKTLGSKIYRYLYDPSSGQVVERLRVECDGDPRGGERLQAVGAQVWRIVEGRRGGAPVIEAFDATTGVTTTTTAALVAAHAELRAGLVEIRDHGVDRPVLITTRDARHFAFDVATGTITDDPSASSPRAEPGASATRLVLVGQKEHSEERGHVYKLVGPSDLLAKQLTSPPSEYTLMQFRSEGKIEATPIAESAAFIEGLMLLGDADSIAILHQDVLGGGAHRLLTVVRQDGSSSPPLPEADLLPSLRDPNATFHDAFFLRSKVAATRVGGLLLVQVPEDGFMGIDLASGQKRFQVSL